MLFLHNFPYYLEKVRPVSSVLDNDSILHNGHIHEADHSLAVCFVLFVFHKRRVIATA